MKKLLAIGLCVIFSANMQASSFTIKTRIKVGQMCGSDTCGCEGGIGMKEKPELA